MLVIENGMVWTGKSGKPVPRTIVIEGCKIAGVYEPGSAPPFPQGSERFDASGKTVVPGLIDCHVHFCMDAGADPMTAAVRDGTLVTAYKAAVRAGQTLKAGVTTIRDLGAPDGIDLALKKSINSGILPGPRMLVSGRVICMTGGHGWTMGYEADGPDECRKAARSQIKAGADVVKVMATGGVMTQGVEPGSPQLTVEEMRAAVEEGHKAGRRCATHAQGLLGIKNAVQAGIDSVEHGVFLDREAVDMMLERGTYLVPTLSAPYNIIKNGVAAGVPEFVVRKTEMVYDSHINSFKLALENGVKIASGTDAGTPFNVHGDLAVELKLMVDAGMPAEKALVSATQTAAELLGMQDHVGSIEPGKFADILVVDGDPTQDITSLQRVVAVFKDGKRVA
ncbi:MAG: amidohydrolase family protein [Firmicutes bacterium]|nr:amidohydrolase family protein [Bacillota bacterium]